jgi:hypothetical protein
MYIDNGEEIYKVFSDCSPALKLSLYRIEGEYLRFYAVADSELQALDNLADNDKLLSIQIDEENVEEWHMTLGSYGASHDTSKLVITQVDTAKFGSFQDFIGHALIKVMAQNENKND